MPAQRLPSAMEALVEYELPQEIGQFVQGNAIAIRQYSGGCPVVLYAQGNGARSDDFWLRPCAPVWAPSLEVNRGDDSAHKGHRFWPFDIGVSQYSLPDRCLRGSKATERSYAGTLSGEIVIC
jgi:hypothetical protein